MSEQEMRNLLTGEVVIEEKLDGSLVWVPAGEWGPYDIFYEDLRIRHSVFYDKLPAWRIFLDVTQADRVLNPELRNQYGDTPPLIDKGIMSQELFVEKLPRYLDRTPAFATESTIEGIVVKNYDKQLFGKVVNIEFYKGIEATGGYLKRRVVERNRLAPLFFNRRNFSRKVVYVVPEMQGTEKVIGYIVWPKGYKWAYYKWAYSEEEAIKWAEQYGAEEVLITEPRKHMWISIKDLKVERRIERLLGKSHT